MLERRQRPRLAVTARSLYRYRFVELADPTCNSGSLVQGQALFAECRSLNHRQSFVKPSCLNLRKRQGRESPFPGVWEATKSPPLL